MGIRPKNKKRAYLAGKFGKKGARRTRRTNSGTHKPVPKAREHESTGAKKEKSGVRSTPLVETPQDLAILNELRQNPEWEIPDSVYKLLPKSLLSMHARTDNPDNTRLQASNQLIKIVEGVQRQRERGASFEFSYHKYAGRHSHAENPEADPDVKEVTSSAYRLKVTEDEAAEAFEELDRLGLLPALFGKKVPDGPLGPKVVEGHVNGNGRNGNGKAKG